MTSVFLFCIVLLGWLFDCVYGSNYECHDAYSCALTSISDTTTTSSDIECYGDHSCARATKIESTANANIYCYGGYSCTQATLIQYTGTSYSRHIYCYGSFSCAYVDEIYNDYGMVYCGGELSCAESAITLKSFSILCYGARACYKSNLTLPIAIFFYGLLSGQGATIEAGDSLVSLSLFGYDAACGAELICNSTCNVFCYGGGCNNFTLGSFKCGHICFCFFSFHFFVLF